MQDVTPIDKKNIFVYTFCWAQSSNQQQQANDVVLLKIARIQSRRLFAPMEAPEEILLNSLATSGIPIPLGCSAVGDLTPLSLFSLCSTALRLIDSHLYASAFPPYLPEDSMPDRVNICTELAHAFNKLGYSPELSFHKVSTGSSPSLLVFTIQLECD